jgi:hypothetical protein
MPSDLQILRTAIKQAKHVGLLQEFRDGYRGYRENGDSVREACWCALYDWDMLDIVAKGHAIGLGFGGQTGTGEMRGYSMSITSRPATKEFRDNWPFGPSKFEKELGSDGLPVVESCAPPETPPQPAISLRPGAIQDIVKLWLRTAGLPFVRDGMTPTSVAVDDLPKLAEFIQKALR